MGMRDRQKKRVQTVALGGLTVALGVTVLYFASILPTGKLALCAVAGILPFITAIKAGLPASFLTYAATAGLGFLLLPDFSITLLYSLFLGLYTPVKAVFEKWIHSPIICWAAKLAFLGAMLSILLFGVKAVLPMPERLLENTAVLYGVCAALFVVYDLALSGLIHFTVTKYRTLFK